MNPPIFDSAQAVLDFADAALEQSKFGRYIARLNASRTLDEANKLAAFLWRGLTIKQKELLLAAYTRRRLER